MSNEEPGFQTGHASGGIFSKILVWEQKGGNSMCCGSSVGELVESGLFFLNKLQK